ncbi:MAG: hypothetical protein HFH87_06720 [Lachnospiraceae bacterium]|nr:hypothetical protein [Lachnospiraceae bacterium]
MSDFYGLWLENRAGQSFAGTNKGATRSGLLSCYILVSGEADVGRNRVMAEPRTGDGNVYGQYGVREW